MNIKTALNWANRVLEKTSFSPALDAEVLLCFALNKPKAWLFTNPDNNLTSEQFNKFKKLISKRRKHWPVAYLTGQKEFFGLAFTVCPHVLIPRPETEGLVNQVLRVYKARKTNQPLKILDVGTGSGCIAIALAKALQTKGIFASRKDALCVWASDISSAALNVARQNARRYKIKINFVKSDLLKNLKSKFDIIVANLPYLNRKQFNNLTIKHEPRQALYGGPDGLKYFRNLFKQISSLNKVEGRHRITLLLEHSPTQKSALAKLAEKYFPSAQISFHKDYGDKVRFVEIKFDNPKAELQ